MKRKIAIIGGCAAVVVISISGLVFFAYRSAKLLKPLPSPAGQVAVTAVPEEKPYVPPDQIKAIFLTSGTALSSRLEDLRRMVKETELNAMIINVNDGVSQAGLEKIGGVVKELNSEGVHTIARVVVFQNQGQIAAHPELAIHSKNGALWHDTGGHAWLDPSEEKNLAATLEISEKAASLGFREINYDYFRFPSEGVTSAVYPLYDKATPKKDVINHAALYLKTNMKAAYPRVLLSADIFAHTLLINGDAGIGQQFTDIVDYFDAICPMVYPSLYASGWFGLKVPATDPYKVVSGTLETGEKKLAALGKTAVIRPWLQDFNLSGIKYTPEMVKAEIQAVNDAGLHKGWLLWNPKNVYSEPAFQKETN